MKRISLLIYIIAATLGLSAQNTIEVAVMSINDFHGGFVRDDFKGIPGAAAMRARMNSLNTASDMFSLLDELAQLQSR